MNNTEKWLNKNEKKIKIIAGIAIILMLLRLVVYAYYRGKSFRKYPKYTILRIFIIEKQEKVQDMTIHILLMVKNMKQQIPKAILKKEKAIL